MSLRIRSTYSPGASLTYDVERLADGAFYDFSTGAFVTAPAIPTTPTATLPEGTGGKAGCYDITYSPTPQAQWPNGDYCVTVHDTSLANRGVFRLGVSMFAGDDATVFPTWPAVFTNFFIPATVVNVSAAPTTSLFQVQFIGAAPPAAGLINLWCNFTTPGRAPEKQQISVIPTVVNPTTLSLQFAIPFATTPLVNDAVAIG